MMSHKAHALGEKFTLLEGMPKTGPMTQKETLNVFEYVLPGGWKVLAGKTDADNDFLSLKTANPKDFWFHVRGMPGSHVLLRARPNEEPDRETLKRAASVAAFHSKARNGGIVAVSCTSARYVKKPRGAKPGSVHIRKESVFKVRPGLFLE